MEPTTSMIHAKPSSLAEKINLPVLGFWISYLTLISWFFGYVLGVI